MLVFAHLDACTTLKSWTVPWKFRVFFFDATQFVSGSAWGYFFLRRFYFFWSFTPLKSFRVVEAHWELRRAVCFLSFRTSRFASTACFARLLASCVGFLGTDLMGRWVIEMLGCRRWPFNQSVICNGVSCGHQRKKYRKSSRPAVQQNSGLKHAVLSWLVFFFLPTVQSHC